jgi:hypothetical protein
LPPAARGRWALAPGRHTIALAAAGTGETLDRVEIVVRGASPARPST